jgi:hypothetical protein
MDPKLHPEKPGRRVAVLDTYTTSGPLSVCYPRLNSTLPPDRSPSPSEDVKVGDPRTGLDCQSLDLMNKAEFLGLDGTVGLLLIK